MSGSITEAEAAGARRLRALCYAQQIAAAREDLRYHPLRPDGIDILTERVGFMLLELQNRAFAEGVEVGKATKRRRKAKPR